MNTFTVRNQHDLAGPLMKAFKREGIKTSSRNGDVTRLEGITSFEITAPWERVCFIRSRNSNPFFHLIEAVAMLAARNSVELLAYFVRRMRQFSDDGLRFNAFYGTRARVTWGDQLHRVIEEIAMRPDTRQAVVNLWDPADLLRETADKACNLSMIFNMSHDGRLVLTTFNRSNDAVWGFGTGANMVHLPMFQEYVAGMLDLPCGSWFHASANLHVYDWNEQWTAMHHEAKNDPEWDHDPYKAGEVTHQPLFNREADREDMDRELVLIVDRMLGVITGAEGTILHAEDLGCAFLRDTVAPVFNTYRLYKTWNHGGVGLDAVEAACHAQAAKIAAPDWRLACVHWLQERFMAKREVVL